MLTRSLLRATVSGSARAAASRLSRLSSGTALADYGKLVFSATEEAQYLSAPVRAALADARASGKPMSKQHANELASSLKAWAAAHGAVSYAHLFYPMRGRIAGEKHDSFVVMDFATGTIKEGFTGAQLFHGETDGSSFPNGGLRDTHAAAAYTTWDMTSAPFVREQTLMIPAAFVSWNGEPLDEKTPLLRSQEAVSTQGLRLLRLLGDTQSKSVITKVGWEQEFFVIDGERFRARPDLIASGRTLFGAKPPRGKQSSANYFARIPLRVRDMLRDAQAEMWASGISCATLHNEVAPAQHETAPIFSITNSAADQNLLAMDILAEAAHRHDLEVLFHEKPFKGLNGSGKHNNWGVNTDTGANIFSPGASEAEQKRFTVFVAALMYALNVHGDVVRAGIATPGNDHRLGAQEAPPAIISLYTGTLMEKHLANVARGGPLHGYTVENGRSLDLGSCAVAKVKAGVEDRNRTAPFPFVGNRFEFRAVGSNQNIMWPLACVQTAFADGLKHIADLVENKNVPLERAVQQTVAESMRIVFNGNGYSAEWPLEAARRGIPNLRTTPAAVDTLNAPKNVELFGRHGIVSAEGVAARQAVLFENYTTTIVTESNAMLNMLRDGILPACMRDTTAAPGAAGALGEFASRKAKLYEQLAAETLKLEASLAAVNADAPREAAFQALALAGQMETTRAVADQVERLVPHDLWPYPKYEELFYSHHSEAPRV
eukprot:Amastigsp_a845891_8.p1 type:complete len:718 gc:universal Amastigsp_a845891_8:2182-29(-)